MAVTPLPISENPPEAQIKKTSEIVSLIQQSEINYLILRQISRANIMSSNEIKPVKYGVLGAVGMAVFIYVFMLVGT